MKLKELMKKIAYRQAIAIVDQKDAAIFIGPKTEKLQNWRVMELQVVRIGAVSLYAFTTPILKITVDTSGCGPRYNYEQPQ